MILLLSVCLGAGPAVSPAPDFDRHIAPILIQRCLDCHSGPAPEAKLDLRRKLSPRAARRAVERVLDEQMPPGKPLPAAEQALLKRWLEAGAVWGTDPIDPFARTTTQRAGRDWWSLQPVRRPLVPTVSGADHPIDAFWLQRLHQAKLTPSPEADRRILIRRLCYDLIGLPPSPAEVEAFVQDQRPDAYERLVDRLLASPRYGERWARHWLDIARFGESDGFERDLPRLNAWPYRDWVVQALNADRPYDQFARAQLIGDLENEAEAAGFLVAGPHDIVLPVGETMRAAMRQDELEDIVGTAAQVFLGLTFHCARCHDHKFDPIPQSDYYRLASALAGVGHGERTLKNPKLEERKKQREQLLAQREALEKPVRARLYAAGKVKPAQPTLAWDFTAGLAELQNRATLVLHGGARRDAQGLHLNGKEAYASVALKGTFKAKTFDVWLKLANLEQRGGGVISLQSADGNVFDALVFGEQQPRHWLAGSDHFRRTRPVGGSEETSRDTLRLTLTYTADGTITLYRDGKPYGKSYQVAPLELSDPVLLLGLRHSPAVGNRLFAGTLLKAQVYDRALSAEEVQGQGVVTTEQVLAELDEPSRRTHAHLSQQIEQLQREIAAMEAAPPKLYTVQPLNPGVTHLLIRGNVSSKADVIAPEVPSVLQALLEPTRLSPDAPESERRRALARWLTDGRNPLFARVIVNRLWHYHFGRGLVESPSDLGFNAGLPTHPELLDWLAAELPRQEWSLKAIHRLIVTSRVYRQASLPRAEALKQDADNRLLWRKSPVRLEAETLRDAMLAISDDLAPMLGGPPYQDFRTYFFKGTQYYDIIEETSNRRSLYRMWARGGRHPFLDTFDCPDPSASTPRRTVTTTPLQALALLNNARVLRQSERLAAALASHPDAIGTLLLRAYGRAPTAQERALMEPFVRQHGLAALVRVVLNSAEFTQID